MPLWFGALFVFAPGYVFSTFSRLKHPKKAGRINAVIFCHCPREIATVPYGNAGCRFGQDVGSFAGLARYQISNSGLYLIQGPRNRIMGAVVGGYILILCHCCIEGILRSYHLCADLAPNCLQSFTSSALPTTRTASTGVRDQPICERCAYRPGL